MKEQLYEELNNFTLWTTKVVSQILMTPEEYVELLKEFRALNNGMVFPLEFHSKPIFIRMETHPHLLLSLEEWIKMGCPKDIDQERGTIGWTSLPCLIRREKAMSLNQNDCSV